MGKKTPPNQENVCSVSVVLENLTDELFNILEPISKDIKHHQGLVHFLLDLTQKKTTFQYTIKDLPYHKINDWRKVADLGSNYYDFLQM